jgi:hypothetical protein
MNQKYTFGKVLKNKLLDIILIILIIAVSTLVWSRHIASVQRPIYKSPIADSSSLMMEKTCAACDGMNMSKSEICKGGAPYSLNDKNFGTVYHEIMNSIIEPPKSKKIFNQSSSSTKLELVLIELRSNLDPSYRSALYNIAHIYGGTDVALTIVCHADAYSQVTDIIDDQWSNVRIINGTKSGKTFGIAEYNKMLTDGKFWDNFDSRFVLITHIDSTIFRKLDDWMYDYGMIGASWGDWEPAPNGKPRVGNGGYTLRHVNSMKYVIKTEKSYVEEHPDGGAPEDVWWHYKIQNLPSESKALEFSFEILSLDDFIPTGAHRMKDYTGTMVKMGKAFRFLQQQYTRCI